LGWPCGEKKLRQAQENRSYPQRGEAKCQSEKGTKKKKSPEGIKGTPEQPEQEVLRQWGKMGGKSSKKNLPGILAPTVTDTMGGDNKPALGATTCGHVGPNGNKKGRHE